jgi:hypothetical protein
MVKNQYQIKKGTAVKRVKQAQLSLVIELTVHTGLEGVSLFDAATLRQSVAEGNNPKRKTQDNKPGGVEQRFENIFTFCWSVWQP